MTALETSKVSTHIENKDLGSKSPVEELVSKGLIIFAHSQGDNSQKTRLVHVIHHFNPNLRMDSDLAKQVKHGLMERSLVYVNNQEKHGHVDETRAKYAVHHVVAIMQEVFNRDATDVDWEGLFVDTVRQDYRFIFDQGGRPGRERGKESYDDVLLTQDPYLSFLCRFGYEGEDTKCEELNLMYSQMKVMAEQFHDGDLKLETIQSGEELNEFRGQFNMVILQYSKTHPRRAETIKSFSFS